MKAYKGSYNGKCESLTYEVGKTYTFNGTVNMCNQGFHFCPKAKDVLTYYPYNKDFVLFEVEAEPLEIKGNKAVTDKIKILRRVPKKEYKELLGIELDANGNLIWCKDSDGYEESWKYDAKGNLIWHKDSIGYEESWKYDAKGNKVWYKNSNGYEWSITID